MRSTTKLTAVGWATVGLLSITIGVIVAFSGTSKSHSGFTSTRTATHSQPPSPAKRLKAYPFGTSVATAIPIQPGAPEKGNSDTVAYGDGSCGLEKGQFWKVALKQGQEVTIEWGPPGTAKGLDIWLPGTTDIHRSDDRRVTYQSVEGSEESQLQFTAPTTGEYPIVIHNTCGHPGPFYFVLGTRPG
jgi:hypothetical protein